MRKWLLLAVLIGGLGLLVGCAGLTASPGPKLATVALEGNPSTGFEWSVSISDAAVLHEISSSYVENEDGIGGTYSWTFEAGRPGAVSVTFAYARSFTDIEPVDWVTYTFIVDDRGVLALDTTNGSLGTIPEPALSAK